MRLKIENQVFSVLSGSFPLALLLFLIFTSENSAQAISQKIVRRDCSFVSRPIIDPRGGIVIGKAIKIVKPRVKGKLKKIAQGEVVEVKIEVNENGTVTNARAESDITELQNASEQAARASAFNPTLVDAVPSKIKGKLIYKFNRGKINISDELGVPELEPQPIDYSRLNLLKIFDSELLSVIYEMREGNKSSVFTFTKNGQANIQICLNTKNRETVEEIKRLGFKLSEETQGNGLVGQIAVENLDKLVVVEEIRRIIPEPLYEPNN